MNLSFTFQGKRNADNAKSVIQERRQWFLQKKSQFDQQHHLIATSRGSFHSLSKTIKQQSEFLLNWLVDKSWISCDSCSCLLHNPMNPKGNVLKSSLPTCSCKSALLPIPSADMFPASLSCLSVQDQELLSPFIFVSGSYKREKHGYRIKTSGFDLITKHTNIWDDIQNIEHEHHKSKLEDAFNHLMTATNSHYSHFIHPHNSHQLESKYSFNRAFQLPYIETAIWPILYFRDDLCESSISQSENSHHSKKKHFFLKASSSIMDYSCSFNLLQFQYERWIYQTITGTIESCKSFNVSAATSLDSKPICHSFWRWQHSLLLDTVDHLGFPSLFVTITADEWRMNKPSWCQQRYNIHNLQPTGDAFAETLQIIHSLQQIVLGFLSCSNHHQWKRHLLANHKHKDRSNVPAYFYRLEFQKRGTPHIHALFWINKIKSINTKTMTSLIPLHDPELAHQVAYTQTSRFQTYTHRPQRSPTMAMSFFKTLNCPFNITFVLSSFPSMSLSHHTTISSPLMVMVYSCNTFHHT